MPRSGPVGLEGVCWLLGGAGGLDSWKEAWRLSLRDILILTDQQTELRWREELFFSVGRRRAVDTLQGHTDLNLLPFFRAAALSGQQEALLQALDSGEEHNMRNGSHHLTFEGINILFSQLLQTAVVIWE